MLIITKSHYTLITLLCSSSYLAIIINVHLCLACVHGYYTRWVSFKLLNIYLHKGSDIIFIGIVRNEGTIIKFMFTLLCGQCAAYDIGESTRKTLCTITSPYPYFMHSEFIKPSSHRI